MNLNKDHIDFKRLKDYYSGNMSSSEKHALEMEALEDPFLKDAMEGFENNPTAIEAFEKNYFRKNKSWRNSIVTRSLTIVGVLLVVYFVALFFKKDPQLQNETVQTIVESDSFITKEIELIPTELETLTVVRHEEQISAESIKNEESTKSIHKAFDYDTLDIKEQIVIEDNDENIQLDLDTKIYPEEHDLHLIEHVPGTYLFYMFVVDYRRIKREKTSIKYTKYELSGTPADMENDEREYEDHELVEKEVEIPYFDYLTTSMEYFRDGYYKKALKRYLIILEQYSTDANALFYGGLCYINMRKYDAALDFFNRLLENKLQAFKEEAKWYKASCLIKLNRKAEAKNVLDEIIIEGGFYLQDAMKLRKEL